NERYCELLAEAGMAGSSVLMVAATGHPIGDVLAQRGFRVASSLNARQAESTSLPPGAYDCAVVIFQLEKVHDPIAFLRRLQSALRPGGVLLIVTPSLDSWPARTLRQQWTEWRPENLYHFRQETLQGALLQTGFDEVRVHQDRRRYSLDHIYE